MTDKTNFAKFIHRQTNEIYYKPADEVAEIEFKEKQWLWNLHPDTIITCYKLTESNKIDSIFNFKLSELKLTFLIKDKNFEIEYMQE